MNASGILRELLWIFGLSVLVGVPCTIVGLIMVPSAVHQGTLPLLAVIIPAAVLVLIGKSQAASSDAVFWLLQFAYYFAVIAAYRAWRASRKVRKEDRR